MRAASAGLSSIRRRHRAADFSIEKKGEKAFSSVAVSNGDRLVSEQPSSLGRSPSISWRESQGGQGERATGIRSARESKKRFFFHQGGREKSSELIFSSRASDGHEASLSLSVPPRFSGFQPLFSPFRADEDRKRGDARCATRRPERYVERPATPRRLRQRGTKKETKTKVR